MARIFTKADMLIGNTPLFEIKNIERDLNLKATVLLKLEMFNPAGSVKDRIAKEMIDDFERRGVINKDTLIIEPTSGNTGIGLALIGASRGYKVTIVMPDTMSVERQKLITAYGANLVLTDGKLGMQGAIDKAEEIKNSTDNAIIASQFANPSNADAHFKTTGPEIYYDADGKVDLFIAGIGTGGTISGTAKFLKSMDKNIKVIGFEPQTSPLITKGVFGAHNLQGIGANFIPKVLDLSVVDEVLTVGDEDAYQAARLLGKSEGLLVGITSGAALHLAIEQAKLEENKGKVIVALMPDTANRYLSTDEFNV